MSVIIFKMEEHEYIIELLSSNYARSDSYFKLGNWDINRCRVDASFFVSMMIEYFSNKSLSSNDINEKHLNQTRLINGNEKTDYNNSNGMDINSLRHLLGFGVVTSEKTEYINNFLNKYGQNSLEQIILKHIDAKIKLLNNDDKYQELHRNWMSYKQSKLINILIVYADYFGNTNHKSSERYEKNTFKVKNKKCYGYIPIVRSNTSPLAPEENHRKLDLSNFSKCFKNSEKINNVTIIFAQRADNKTWIKGFYKMASLFSEIQKLEDSNIFYYAEADSNNVVEFEDKKINLEDITNKEKINHSQSGIRYLTKDNQNNEDLGAKEIIKIIKWIDSFSNGDIEKIEQFDDIVKIRSNNKISSTEKETLIMARIGQGKYRNNLLDLYKNKCILSDIELNELLIASHIVPWKEVSDEEKIDRYNGLLLSSNIDKLFDRHLISFDNKGFLVFNEQKLSKDILLKCGIKQEFIDRSTSLKDIVSDKTFKYLLKHFERYSKKN